MLRHSNYCEFGISDFGNRSLFFNFLQNINQKVSYTSEIQQQIAKISLMRHPEF